jgi:DNA-binding transcriptional LysR family regulator
MNLQDIKAFVAVAETGSVNRAALRLNLTQPATSRRIQNFEYKMGAAPLFNRAVKPAVLTSLGKHVLEHCRQVLAAVAELETCTKQGGEPTGDLKAGIAHGFGEIVLTKPLDTLRRSFPRLRLQISSNWTTALIEEVRAGALDCAIGLLTDMHAIPVGVVRLPLGREQVVIVAPSAMKTKHGRKTLRLSDLTNYGWILNPPGCGCRAALVKAFDRQELPMHIMAEVFGEDLQLSLLASSGGLGLVPRQQFENSPHRRKLRILNVRDFELPATVALIKKAAPGRFDTVIDLLTRALKFKMS